MYFQSKPTRVMRRYITFEFESVAAVLQRHFTKPRAHNLWNSVNRYSERRPSPLPWQVASTAKADSIRRRNRITFVSNVKKCATGSFSSTSIRSHCHAYELIFRPAIAIRSERAPLSPPTFMSCYLITRQPDANTRGWLVGWADLKAPPPRNGTRARNAKQFLTHRQRASQVILRRQAATLHRP